MKPPLKCGVVGVGYLGKAHARKYAELEEAELVAISDLDESSGAPIANELGTQFFVDYRSLVGKVEAVAIVTSTPSHYEIAKFFLDQGVHILVEKPMTTTSSEAQELCDLAAKNRLKLQVGHIERFNSAWASVRERINAPLFLEARRLAPFKARGSDVSVILDLMVHDLDLVLSLTPGEVSHISAVGTSVVTDFPDIANAWIEFEGGFVANLSVSRVSRETERTIRVSQSDRCFSMDLQSGRGVCVMGTNGPGQEKEPLEDFWSSEKSDALLTETRSFISSIQNNQDCLVSGRDGMRALQLAERVTQEILKKKS